MEAFWAAQIWKVGLTEQDLSFEKDVLSYPIPTVDQDS